MPLPRRFTTAPLAASLVLMLGLAGCSDDGVIYDNVPTAPAAGNWQVSNAGTGTVPIQSFSGAISVNGTDVTGTFHADESTGCVTETTPVALTGTTNTSGVTTLTGSIAGGTLTVTGTLATGGTSMTDATYNIAGGQCAFTAAATANVQNYSPVTGSYAGNFTDGAGQTISVTANLTQAPTGDTDGNFALSGTGSFAANGCFTSPVTITNSQVTGGSFTITYAQSGNSVTAVGSFSTDGTTLTVTGWTLTGTCGADSGTGVLTQQAQSGSQQPSGS